MQDKKVLIIGLGLIGGSLAKALRERIGIKNIAAFDNDINALSNALDDGIISKVCKSVTDYVSEADIIFLCTPVKTSIEYLKIIAKSVNKNCVITDVCSTKSEITNCIKSMADPPNFIGGHPMSGSEKAGYAASSSHLFENAYYVLTPISSSGDECLSIMTEIVKRIGAIPIIIDAEEHDKITAAISHVPHIIASALVNMIEDIDSSDGRMRLLAAGGFKDITRIASSSPQMWESIILSNKQKISDMLDTFIKYLYEFKKSVELSDSSSIFSFFDKARLYRAKIPDAKKGLIEPSYEIVVDVVDKPGIIGKITTILGNNGINIKNINVSNSREYEQGCLRITLTDSSSVKAAYDVLTSHGYKVYKK